MTSRSDTSLLLTVEEAARLDDWPLERSMHEDLGVRFIHALRLLREACSDARRYAIEVFHEEMYSDP